MRIALFGGSFDPPHCGHIGIAQAAADRLALDRVLMAPVGRQPLKRHQAQSSYRNRLAMVQLACQGHPRLEPSEIDAPADGDRLNYTYDALQRLRRQLTDGDALFCLIGADSLTTLQRWHRAAEAMLLAEWVVAARPGFALETLSRLLPQGVTAGQPVVSGDMTRVPLLGHAASPVAHGALWLLPDLHYEVSATQLRKTLADHSAGIPQRVLDPRVADYARSHMLYDGEALARAEP